MDAERRAAAERAMLDASEALDAGDLGAAAAALVRAAAHDPFDDEPRLLMSQLAALVATPGPRAAVAA
jgi:hypothetical protein